MTRRPRRLPSRPFVSTTIVESRSRTPSRSLFVCVAPTNVRRAREDREARRSVYAYLNLKRHFSALSVPLRSSAPDGRSARPDGRGASECLGRAAGVAA